MNIKAYQKTVICDVDGCILRHQGKLSNIVHAKRPVILPGVRKMFDEWNDHSCYIVLLTGRKESARWITESQLREMGLFWDVLVMGASRGERVLINDQKPDGMNTARAINLERNKGMLDVDMDWYDFEKGE